MKRLLALLLCTLFLFSACGQTDDSATVPDDTGADTESLEDTADAVNEEVDTADRTQMNIAFLKGPTGLAAANLMDANDADTTKNEYEVTLASTPDEISTKLIQGEVAAAAVPTNLAATLYNKTEGNIKLLATNTLGVLYIVDSTGEIKELSDLEGKTLYATGQGSTPQFVLEHILAENGLSDSVTVEYKTEHAELATLVAAGEAEIAMLPEPFVTSATTENAVVAIDLQAEWEKISAAPLAMGVIAVNAEFLENNPEAIDYLIEDLDASVKLSASDIDGTAALAEKYDIMPEAVVKQALPRCNIVLMTSEESKTAVSAFLTVLNDINPDAIGGKLPSEDFYIIKGE